MSDTSRARHAARFIPVDAQAGVNGARGAANAGSATSADGTRGPQHYRIVPARRWTRVAATVLALALVAAVLHSALDNPRWEWDVFAQWFLAPPVLAGLAQTLVLTALGAFFGFALAMPLALARLARSPLPSACAWAYIWLFRSIPPIVLLLLLNNLGYLYETVSLGVPFTHTTLFSAPTTDLLSPFWAAVLGLTLNHAAFAAEAIRGGILSVDQGQREAAAALGLPRARQVWRIVLPQAMRAILPTAFNDVIGLAKGTSVVYILAMPDLFYTVQIIYHRNLEVIPLLMVATVWYLVILTVLSVVQRYVERHYARGATRAQSAPPLFALFSRFSRAKVLRARRRTEEGSAAGPATGSKIGSGTGSKTDPAGSSIAGSAGSPADGRAVDPAANPVVLTAARSTVGLTGNSAVGLAVGPADSSTDSPKTSLTGGPAISPAVGFAASSTDSSKTSPAGSPAVGPAVSFAASSTDSSKAGSTGSPVVGLAVGLAVGQEVSPAVSPAIRPAVVLKTNPETGPAIDPTIRAARKTHPAASAQTAGWAQQRVGGAVGIHDVSKSFGALRVLDHVSLSIPSGSVSVILGPSGSGKSTLLRTINHLERVDGGFIDIDGELVGYRRDGHTLYELGEKDILRRRAEVGMVFQNFNLFGHLSVLQNLVEAPLAAGVPRAQAEELARALLARVGLAERANAWPRQLSGGQQQRVAIARALALRPKVLLFDEPTSALDPELVNEVLDVIRQLTRSGTTLIIVTHEIGFAREVADTIVFMHGGRILESGAPDQVLRNPSHPRTREFLSRVL